MRHPDARVAHACVAIVVAAGALAALAAPDLYVRVAQEDEIVEWATFWSLVAASALHAGGASGTSRRRRWFGVAVGVSCLVVAMEEISWGQRLLGVRPPEYFLAHNYQQELNAHNLLPKVARKLAMAAILGGYGVALPLLRRWPRPRLLLRRAGIVAPPWTLAPVFALALLLHVAYPVKLAGEWVELLLGLGLLFSALLAPRERIRTRLRPTAVQAIALGAVVVAAAASSAWSRHGRASSPVALAMARAEADALREDVAAGGRPDRERVHVRACTYATRHGARLHEGRFAALAGSGLPEDRARYFLDPWNGAYWVEISRDGDETMLLVYSFGANRARETFGLELGGDDVGSRGAVTSWQASSR